MVDLWRLRHLTPEQIGSREAEICLKKLNNQATADDYFELEMLGKIKRENQHRRGYTI